MNQKYTKLLALWLALSMLAGCSPVLLAASLTLEPYDPPPYYSYTVEALDTVMEEVLLDYDSYNIEGDDAFYFLPYHGNTPKEVLDFQVYDYTSDGSFVYAYTAYFYGDAAEMAQDEGEVPTDSTITGLTASQTGTATQVSLYKEDAMTASYLSQEKMKTSSEVASALANVDSWQIKVDSYQVTVDDYQAQADDLEAQIDATSKIALFIELEAQLVIVERDLEDYEAKLSSAQSSLDSAQATVDGLLEASEPSALVTTIMSYNPTTRVYNVFFTELDDLDLIIASVDSEDTGLDDTVTAQVVDTGLIGYAIPDKEEYFFVKGYMGMVFDTQGNVLTSCNYEALIQSEFTSKGIAYSDYTMELMDAVMDGSYNAYLSITLTDDSDIDEDIDEDSEEEPFMGYYLFGHYQLPLQNDTSGGDNAVVFRSRNLNQEEQEEDWMAGDGLIFSSYGAYELYSYYQSADYYMNWGEYSDLYEPYHFGNVKLMGLTKADVSQKGEINLNQLLYTSVWAFIDYFSQLGLFATTYMQNAYVYYNYVESDLIGSYRTDSFSDVYPSPAESVDNRPCYGMGFYATAAVIANSLMTSDSSGTSGKLCTIKFPWVNYSVYGNIAWDAVSLDSKLSTELFLEEPTEYSERLVRYLGIETTYKDYEIEYGSGKNAECEDPDYKKEKTSENYEYDDAGREIEHTTVVTTTVYTGDDEIRYTQKDITTVITEWIEQVWEPRPVEYSLNVNDTDMRAESIPGYISWTDMRETAELAMPSRELGAYYYETITESTDDSDAVSGIYYHDGEAVRINEDDIAGSVIEAQLYHGQTQEICAVMTDLGVQYYSRTMVDEGESANQYSSSAFPDDGFISMGDYTPATDTLFTLPGALTTQDTTYDGESSSLSDLDQLSILNDNEMIFASLTDGLVLHNLSSGLFLTMTEGTYFQTFSQADDAGTFMVLGYDTTEYAYRGSDIVWAKYYEMDLDDASTALRDDMVTQHLDTLYNLYIQYTHDVALNSLGIPKVYAPDKEEQLVVNQGENLFNSTASALGTELQSIVESTGQTSMSTSVREYALTLYNQMQSQRAKSQELFDMVGIVRTAFDTSDATLLWLEKTMYYSSYTEHLEDVLVELMVYRADQASGSFETALVDMLEGYGVDLRCVNDDGTVDTNQYTLLQSSIQDLLYTDNQGDATSVTYDSALISSAMNRTDAYLDVLDAVEAMFDDRNSVTSTGEGTWGSWEDWDAYLSAALSAVNPYNVEDSLEDAVYAILALTGLEAGSVSETLLATACEELPSVYSLFALEKWMVDVILARAEYQSDAKQLMVTDWETYLSESPSDQDGFYEGSFYAVIEACQADYEANHNVDREGTWDEQLTTLLRSCTGGFIAVDVDYQPSFSTGG